QTSCGYLGTSDGWTDLRSDYAMDWHYPSATSGNVVETGRLKLDGTGQQHATLALGFAGTTPPALSAAQASLASGFPAVSSAAAAGRALTYLFDRQQKPDGSFPQNSTVDGTPHWTNVQLDEVADPIILAWMLHRTDGTTYQHVKKAADYILANGPSTPQERWEN